jgi:uncharacterized membrane protein YsdA (DUF1294 family)
MGKIVMIYLIIINLYGYFIMYNDKERAKQGKYRIPEATLWRVTIMGGAIGTAVGMKAFRHKTQHATFRFGFTFFAVMDILIACYILFF